MAILKVDKKLVGHPAGDHVVPKFESLQTSDDEHAITSVILFENPAGDCLAAVSLSLFELRQIYSQIEQATTIKTILIREHRAAWWRKWRQGARL